MRACPQADPSLTSFEQKEECALGSANLSMCRHARVCRGAKSDEAFARSTRSHVCLWPERATTTGADCDRCAYSSSAEDYSRYADLESRETSNLTIGIDRLLDLLSLILSGQHYKPLGAPASLLRADSSKDGGAAEVSPPSYASCLDIDACLIGSGWPEEFRIDYACLDHSARLRLQRCVVSG